MPAIIYQDMTKSAQGFTLKVGPTIGKWLFWDQLRFIQQLHFPKSSTYFVKGTFRAFCLKLHNQHTINNTHNYQKWLSCNHLPPPCILSRSVWSSNIHYIFASQGLFNIHQSTVQWDAYIFLNALRLQLYKPLLPLGITVIPFELNYLVFAWTGKR